MHRPMHSLAASLVLVAPVAYLQADDAPGFRAPDGFHVTLFADSDLADDIYCLTINAAGRVTVAGRGYVRTLHDRDGDGIADDAITFAESPASGTMGLLWEGEHLYVVGDGGLRRFRDEDGDGRADGPSQLIRKMKTGGEHHAHAVRRGPDGWLYVMCGNFTRIGPSDATTATSPITEPIAGALLRLSPDFSDCEIVADGFRNAYDFDFNLDGEIFTYDSDNERCVSLPWYEPTRFYHVIPGGHYGWQAPQRAATWRMPPYFFDVVEPVASIARGSPTGVICYRHTGFPAKYHGGFFLADWTFGLIYFVAPEPRGASYHGQPEVFLRSVGDNGFAPTGIALHPITGDLYVSVGGRGTRGAVYRITGPPLHRQRPPHALPTCPRRLEWDPDDQAGLIQAATGGDAPTRLRALQKTHRFREHFDADTIRSVIRANWDHFDRAIRKATVGLLESLDENERRLLLADADGPYARLTAAWSLRDDDPDPAARAATGVFLLSSDDRRRLTAVRVLQGALGDLMDPKVSGSVWEGYSRRRRRRLSATMKDAIAALRESFPTGNHDVDFEIARVFPMVEDGDPTTLRNVLGRITAASHPVDDIHYLIVLARLTAPRDDRDQTRRTARALLALDQKITRRELNRDRHWPTRVRTTYRRLARKDDKLHNALLADETFGRPDHTIFAAVDGFSRSEAAEVFLKAIAKDADFPWTDALVTVLSALPDGRLFPILREQWDNRAVRPAIIRALARNPMEADRRLFLEALLAHDLDTVSIALGAVRNLPPPKDPRHLIPVIRAHGRLRTGARETGIRDSLHRYLADVTGQRHVANQPAAWSTWFAGAYPQRAAELSADDSVDLPAWKKRLAAIDFDAGDPDRGKSVYTRAACGSCHSGAQARGPDLAGVAVRFARDDLFTAILQPSRDVPPQYQTTLFVTKTGDAYQGTIAYEAVDSVILQTGPETTVRIAGEDILGRKVSQLSLMPTGLLDDLTDEQIADLYAYLKTLK